MVSSVIELGKRHMLVMFERNVTHEQKYEEGCRDVMIPLPARFKPGLVLLRSNTSGRCRSSLVEKLKQGVVTRGLLHAV